MSSQESQDRYSDITPVVVPVDTVHLFTEDFTWNGNQSGWDKAIWYRREKPYPESKPYVTAERHEPQTGWHVRMWRRRLHIEGSLPRLKHPGDNTQPLLLTDFILVTRYLVDLQERLGLSFNTGKLRLARVDIFRNLEVAYPAAIVVGRLSTILHIGNMPQSAKPDLYRGPYIRWGNSHRQLVIYEKNTVNNYKDFVKNGWRLRFEYRLRGVTSCRRYGFSTFPCLADFDLLNATLDGQLSILFSEAEKRGLFPDSDEAVDASSILTETMRSKDFRVPELPKVVAGLGGIERVLNQLGGETTLHEVARDLGVPRYTRDRMKKTLADMVRYSNLLKATDRTKSLGMKRDLMSLLGGQGSPSCASSTKS